MTTAHTAPGTTITRPDVEQSTVIETDVSTFTQDEHAPICEVLPGGKKCYRQAAWSAMITTHGCERDGKHILMCKQCYDKIYGGTVCAVCGDYPIKIERGILL